ncbi:STA31 protein, partial [Rhagologus leucostigma]|nr:STA31 protein [Rhagologus leucostigma]
QEVLAQMQQLLGRSETLRELLQQELGAWRERQQRLCLGGPGDTNLRPMETWFTELGQGLFQLRQLLQALSDLRLKVTYERDPLVAETPLLEQRLLEQLTHLLKSAFVVEQQPSTPNAGKRPLVLRTASKFSARARLLVRLHDRNHRMEAKIHIDRECLDNAQALGFCDWGIFGVVPCRAQQLDSDNPTGPAPNSGYSMTLRTGGAPGGSWGSPDPPVSPSAFVVEQQPSTPNAGKRPLTTTLPFVIISNNNQFSSAWASILWFNMLSSDPK